MKVLFTADLHLVPATRTRTLGVVRSWVDTYQPDALVVAGDTASAAQADGALGAIRATFPEGPVAICLGNHDFWLNDDARPRCRDLDDVVDAFWVPAARAHNITLLDRTNLELPSLTLAGAYGHYDFGFAVPGLTYGDEVISSEDYLRGYCRSVLPLRWRDFQLMPADLDPWAVAAHEVGAAEKRLLAGGNRPTLFVTHTPPVRELLGIRPLGPAPVSPPPLAFFRAYLGNQSMGEMLQRHRQRLAGMVCGHTHRPAGPLYWQGIPAINIGSDYGAPRAALYLEGCFSRVP
ncbi:MAG TPA: metallophosphoesterase [Chthoniobacterales bacterium]